MPETTCEKDTTSEIYNFLVFYTPHASIVAFITNFMVTFSIIGALDKFIISITTSKLPIADYIKSFSRKVVLFFLALGITFNQQYNLLIINYSLLINHYYHLYKKVSIPCFISTTLIKYIDINIASSDRYYKLPSVTNTAVVPYEKISW